MDKIKLIIYFSILLAIVVVPFCNSNVKRLGGAYEYDTDGKRIFGPDIDIPPIIMHYEYNDRYILVQQKPCKNREEAIYDRTYLYPMGRDTIYYWIIDKQKHSYDGPMLYKEFTIKTERLNLNLLNDK